MSILLQTIGLLVPTLFLGWLAAMGFFGLLFNDIGGNGSRRSAIGWLALMAGSVYAICFLWAAYSPFTIAVAT